MEEHQDDGARLEALIAAAIVTLRRSFARALRQVAQRWSLDQIEELILARRFDDALAMAELAAANLANDVTEQFLRSARDTSRFLSDTLDVVVTFDQTNERAVAAMRQNQLRLIREFTREQQRATRIALVEGIQQGLNPREQARLFRSSLGLTARQMQAVANYRRLLEAGDSAALTRALRDKRFDSSVRAAVSGDRPLTLAQIDRMVERYREKYVRYRGEVIARTEALRSVHEGATAAYEQAIASGVLDADALTRTWITASDERVRGSHSFMHGQQRLIDQPFVSGAGNRLRWPGDIDAPGSETIQCRCVLTTQFTVDAEAQEIA